MSIPLKILAGVGALGAGLYGSWHFYSEGVGGYGGWGREGGGVAIIDRQKPAQIVLEEGKDFSEFSGYQNDLQALMYQIKNNNLENIFNNLSSNWKKNKNNLINQVKEFNPFFEVTYEQLKNCNCAKKSGVENMDSMDKFMEIVKEINEGNDSSKVSEFSELFRKVYGDLKVLEKLIEGPQ